MCIWDSYVYQKGVLRFLIHKSYVRSIVKYCFVRKYAAIPVQLEIFILQYVGWCVLIINIIISIIISFMQGIYTYIPETNYVPGNTVLQLFCCHYSWCLYR